MKYETRHSYTHKGCIFTSFRFCVGPLMMKSRCNWNPVSRSVFLANLAYPIKTQNPTPTSNWNSRFPTLFPAQIPNITAETSQIPHRAKPIGTLMMDVTAREELSKVHSPMMPAPFTKKKVRGGGRGVVVVVKVETENWELRFRNCEFGVVECQLWLLNCQLWKWLLHLLSLNLKFSLKKSTFSLELLLLEIDFRIWVLTFNGRSRPPYMTAETRSELKKR